MPLNEQDRARVAEIQFKHSNIEAAWNGKYSIYLEWDENDIAFMLSLIDRLSEGPDGPDVVFCEDCAYFKCGECNSAYGLPDPVDETDFCSYGERAGKERDDG